MFDWLNSRLAGKTAADTLYGEIVSAARAPKFYRDWGVPDTVEGRFEMIALHLALALDRLSVEGEAGQALGRAVTEACIVDLDDNMREIGIGDLAVPRKIKKAAAALFDRHRDITAALAATDSVPLQAALQRDIGALPGAVQFNARALANYSYEQRHALANVAREACLNGTLSLQRPTV